MTPSEVPFDVATLRERIRAFKALDKPATLIVRTTGGRTLAVRDPSAIGLSTSDRHVLVRDEGEDFDEVLLIDVDQIAGCELRPRPRRTPEWLVAILCFLLVGTAVAVAMTLLSLL
jgi:hypothetical protein